MSTSRSTDDVMRALNDRAKALGRYLVTSFSDIPRSPGSLLDRPDTAESDERIRKAQQYLAGERHAKAAATARAETMVENADRAPVRQGAASAEHNEGDPTETPGLHVAKGNSRCTETSNEPRESFGRSSAGHGVLPAPPMSFSDGGSRLDLVRSAVTPEQFWEAFAGLLCKDLSTFGPDWGKTYEPSKSWTAYMLSGSQAFLVRLGNSLGYDCRPEFERIDMSYYGADGVRYVAIEHEGGPYHFPEGEREKGWKHEFSLLVRKPVPLRVLVIYDKRPRSAIEANLAQAVEDCCPADLIAVNNGSFLVIVGPYFRSYLTGTGIADYLAYKLVDGHFAPLPSLRVLPRR